MQSSAHPAGIYGDNKKSTQKPTSLTIIFESTDNSDGESFQRFECQPCQKRSEFMLTLFVIEKKAELLKDFPASTMKITVEGHWNNTDIRYFFNNIESLKTFIDTVVAMDLLHQMRIIDNPEYTSSSAEGQEYLKKNLHLFPDLCEKLSNYSQFLNGNNEEIDRADGTGEFAESYKDEVISRFISPTLPELNKWITSKSQDFVFTP